MKRTKFIFLILAVLLLSSFRLYQELGVIDFTDKIKSHDLSLLFTTDSIHVSDERIKVDKQEPLGFIGDNYQRFYIHFTSVKKKPENPMQYFVSGKTRVKNNICDFKGTITILSAKLRKGNSQLPTRQGFAIGKYKFYENSTLPATGFMEGKVTTNFYLDKRQRMVYDDLESFSDNFANNQFQGTWTSYKTGAIKKCNWGDYRIPASNGLDIGVAEFMVHQKYAKNGWENYLKAWNGDADLPATKIARREENAKWWK